MKICCWLVAACVVAAGCDDHGAKESSVTLYSTCESTADCAGSGLLCDVERGCVECRFDEECSERSYCELGICEPLTESAETAAPGETTDERSTDAGAPAEAELGGPDGDPVSGALTDLELPAGNADAGVRDGASPATRADASVDAGSSTALDEVMDDEPLDDEPTDTTAAEGLADAATPNASATDLDGGELVAVRAERHASIAEAEALWDASGITRYEWHVERLAYTSYGLASNVRGVVRNGVIESLLGGRSQQLPDTPLDLDDALAWHTVDGFFDFMHEAVDLDVDIFDFTFNSDYGYPESAIIDPYAMAVDDEFTFLIRDFEQPPPPLAVYGAEQCADFASVEVGRYTVMNNAYGGASHCIVALWEGDSRAGFALSSVEANVPTPGPPASYPTLVYGWSVDGQFHGSEYTMARRLSGLVSLWSGLDTTVPASGVFDTAHTIWISDDPAPSSDQGTVELALWSNVRDATPTGSPIDSISGEYGAYEVWFGTSAGVDTVTYVRTARTASALLDLYPLVQDAIDRGYVGPEDYLLGVQVGFEVWQASEDFRLDALSLNLTWE